MKNRLNGITTLLLSLALVSGLGAGCAWSIGGSHGAAPGSAQPTKGQELIDLKKARDQNVISEKEYQEQRAKLMER